MTRQSKQGERRAQSRKRPSAPAVKTGPKKDNLPKGYREHANALAAMPDLQAFIPKIR